MAKDSRGNQWITSDAAVKLFNAVAKLESLHDFSNANQSLQAAWREVSDTMEQIREA